MTRNVLAVALACLCLFEHSPASAWTKEGDKIVFRGGEVSHCDALAMDAGAIMLGRQANEPPYYANDEYGAPTAATLSLRDTLSTAVLSYPVRDTREERQKDLEDFVKSVRGLCMKAYIESVPESPAQAFVPTPGSTNVKEK